MGRKVRITIDGCPKGHIEVYVGSKGYYQCRECQRDRHARRKLDPEYRNDYIERSRRYRASLKKKVMNYYGGKCECCGESEIAFLTLDHINNDGSKQRKELKRKGGGDHFYLWVIKNDFPKDLRILCFNCNCGRRHGICPHQKIGGN